MKPLFITGSGTSIGKTFVTSALCWQLRQSGKKARALKPVATGVDPDDMQSDAALLLRAMEIEHTLENIWSISPWHFTEPLAPSLAALKEGRSVDMRDLADFCRGNVREGEIMLCEGAGGVMAPLTETHTVLDWIEALKWDALVVVGTYLGALSHALTSLEVLQSRDLPVRAIVVSESEVSCVSLEETASLLAPFAQNVSVIKLPRLENAADAWKNAPSLLGICA